MNSDRLSARLSTVAKYVTKGERIADIGSDHAYLPCWLVKNGIVPFAIAGEVADGPYQSARKNVIAEGLTGEISVRKGDGLAVIEAGDVDCITIAGMGGALITSILEAGKDKLRDVKKLILQPNISAISIRKWFLENNWELTAEEIMEEDGKIYEVLVGEPGDARRPYGQDLELGLLVGPILVEKQNEAFKNKWSAELKSWRRVYQELEHAVESQEAVEKRQELVKKIHLIEEALNS